MKLLQNILIIFLMGIALVAHAVEQDVKVDLLMAKITASIKADKATDALPYFAELEGMESSLAQPLPQSFHYYYIETLSKSGNNDKALSRADIYLSKFGKKGKYYAKVIEIISPIQIQKDKDTAVRAAKIAEYNQAQSRYEADIKNCEDKTYPERLEKLGSEAVRLGRECQFYGKYDCGNYDDEKAKKLYRDWKNAQRRIDDFNKIGPREYCEGKYTAPKKPD